MGTFHFTQSIVQRSKGHAATRASAYITGEKVIDSLRGKTFDYSHKEEVVAHYIELPDNAPEELRNLSFLTSEIEKCEKGNKAQLAIRGDAALPACNTREENIALVHEFVKPWKEQGFPVVWGIHEKEGNPHFHFLVPQRKIEVSEDGSWKFAAKSHKEYKIKIDGKVQKDYVSPARFKELKEQGVDVKKIKGGKDGKPISRKANDGFDSSKETLLLSRAKWEGFYNASTDAHYSRLGMENPEEPVSCKSYEARGINKIPQKHEGPAPTPEVLAYNTKVKEFNSFTDKIRSAVNEVKEVLNTWWTGTKPSQQTQQRRKHIAQDRSRALSLFFKHKSSPNDNHDEKTLTFKEKVVSVEAKNHDAVETKNKKKEAAPAKEYSPFDDVADFKKTVKAQDAERVHTRIKPNKDNR